MNREILLDQIDFVQARIEEIDSKVINWKPEDKGYKELLDSYNKWIDRYDVLLDRLEHIDDLDVERERNNLDRDKLTIQETIEQDKIELEKEQLRLDREKFAYDIENQKKKEVVEIIFRSADLGVKVLIPTLAIAGTWAVAKLSYMNDAELKLCNGRVAGNVKELLKIATMKI